MSRIVAVLFFGVYFQVMASSSSSSISITKMEAESKTILSEYSLTVYKKRVRRFLFRFAYQYELTAVGGGKTYEPKSEDWIQGYSGVFWDNKVENWPYVKGAVNATFRVNERGRTIIVEYKDAYGAVGRIKFIINSIE